MPTTNVVIPNMVKGPASATDDAFVKYDGTTGKLLKDGVLGSNGGNGASDGGKVVLFKSTGAIEGRCSATFGVRGTTVSGAGVSGESETGVGVEADATDGGIGLNAVSIGAGGIPIVGTNATSGEVLLQLINAVDNDTIEILSDGTIRWTNTTGDGAAGTRKNVLPSRTGNALKFLRINSDESDWEAAFVMREVDISVTPTLVLGDGELAFDTAGTGFYLGDGSSTLADLVNGARNWWDVATTVGSFLQIANDLSDLNDAATARTNLGLGALATLAAVDTAEITDGAVTEDKLDDDAVATAKIADEAVTFAKLAPAAVVTEAEGIASNDNDTTIPTSAAVKAYADSVAGSSTDQIDFFIPVPINGTVTLRLNAKYAFTVDNLSIKTTSGTITAALQIDGVNVTSISAVAVTSTEQTATATGANSAATGTTLNLVLTSNSSAANLSGSIQITRA